MEAEYRRDTGHTYMTIEEEPGCAGSSYEMRILEENHIRGLLSVQVEAINSRRYYRYDISELRPFEGYCRIVNPGKKEMKNLLESVLASVMRFEDYLLDPDHILLDPEYLFVSTEKDEVVMAYVPFHKKDIRLQLQKLLEYFMMQVDHSDHETIVFICRVMHELKAVNAELESILALIVNDGRMPDSSAFHCMESADGNGIPAGANKEDYPVAAGDTIRASGADRKSGKAGISEKAAVLRPEPMTLMIAAAGMGAALIMYLVLHFSRFAGLGTNVIAGASAAVGAAAGLIVCMAKRIAKNREDDEDGNLQYPENDFHRNAVFPERDDSADKPDCKSPENTFTIDDDNMPGMPQIEETVLLSEYADLHGRKTDGAEAYLEPDPPSDKLPVIRLGSGDILIGKQAESVDFVLPDNTVSRVHARIFKNGGKYYLSDLGSKNGTSADGELIAGGREKELADGVRVKFAGCGYVFREVTGRKF